MPDDDRRRIVGSTTARREQVGVEGCAGERHHWLWRYQNASGDGRLCNTFSPIAVPACRCRARISTQPSFHGSRTLRRAGAPTTELTDCIARLLRQHLRRVFRAYHVERAVRRPIANDAAMPARTAAQTGHATRALEPAPSPAAATISGDGVSPAASAAASGSPPGSAADTASADAGRRSGSGSRQRRIARSIAGVQRH